MPAERSKFFQKNRCDGPLQMKVPMYENTNSGYFQVCNTTSAPDVAIEETVQNELQIKKSTTTRLSTLCFPLTSQERDIFRTRAGKVS